MTKKIIVLIILFFPLLLTAQHGLGGAGALGEVAIGIFSVVLVVSLFLVFVNILAAFRPITLLYNMGIVLSSVLLLYATLVLVDAFNAGVYLKDYPYINFYTDTYLPFAFLMALSLLSLVNLSYKNRALTAKNDTLVDNNVDILDADRKL